MNNILTAPALLQTLRTDPTACIVIDLDARYELARRTDAGEFVPFGAVREAVFMELWEAGELRECGEEPGDVWYEIKEENNNA